MKIISHRGNLNGRVPEMENHPKHIISAVYAGYDVEVDVWSIDGEFFLGHDHPQYSVELSWIRKFPLWCHAKNIEAFSRLLEYGIHCFWHDRDMFTLTSCGIPWCYPGNWIKGGVTVVKDFLLISPPSHIFGVCVDDPIRWSEL